MHLLQCQVGMPIASCNREQLTRSSHLNQGAVSEFSILQELRTNWCGAGAARTSDPCQSNYRPRYVAPEPPVVRTATEIAEQERLHRAFREEHSRKLHLQEEIEHRAEELFLSFLNEEQRESYRKKQEVIVCAKSGTRYRIFCAGLGRIRELDRHDREIAQYCSHVPHGELPGADNWLAQMLAVRFDEKEGFLLRANRSPMAVVPLN